MPITSTRTILAKVPIARTISSGSRFISSIFHTREPVNRRPATRRVSFRSDRGTLEEYLLEDFSCTKKFAAISFGVDTRPHRPGMFSTESVPIHNGVQVARQFLHEHQNELP